jgi:hypothetical protein
MARREFISISVNAENVIKTLSDIKKRRLPFAMANALTQTAKQSQFVVQKRLREIFTIRNTWTERGIKITPARKSDSDQFAEVKVDRNYLVLQDLGGEKITHNGHRYVCVPIRENLGIGNADIIRQRQRPSALIAAGKAFKVQLKDGRLFLFERISTGRGAARASTIVPIYRLVLEARVRPVLQFESTVLDVVRTNFIPNFYDSLEMFRP